MALNNISDIAKAKFHNTPIRIRAIVSGRSATPYKIPKRVEFKCLDEECKGGKCKYQETQEITVHARDEKFLMFLDTPTQRIPATVKAYLGTSCRYVSAKVLETQNVLRIFISQPPGEDRTKWHAAQTSYFVGHDLDSNHTYYLDGYSTVEPKSQITTYVFRSAEKAKSDVESFNMSPKMHKRLSVFERPDFETVEDVYAYLGELYESYARNVTKIYGRFLLHMVVDIAFHSALEFKFPGGKKTPARIDAIVLGDTRCGKGHVAEGLHKYYGVGEVVGAENCTFAGLVGGAQQIGAHWVISWGRIPLNDRGFVTIDEASELQDGDWTRMSRIRSEGIAEVTKIVQQVTNARTRLLFLANPPSRSMANYSFGIHALQDLVHAPEDIARFDYACIVSHEEVPIEDINKMHDEADFLYTQKEERELIMWIWSRTADQIEFTKEAVAEVFKTANRLGKFYDIGIPLIQGENVRFKVAKIAIAYAGRLYSNENNGQILKVKKLHVECAAAFLRGVYRADVNGYYDHSWQKKELNPKLQDKNIIGITSYFRSFKSEKEAYEYLMSNTFIQAKDITEHLDVSMTVATEVIYHLIKFKCIVKKGPLYVKTAHFTRWLRGRVRKDRKKGDPS